MKGIAYYNGIFSSFDEVRIPLSDRAVFFGDGVYDAALVRNGKIYLENEHVNRFFNSARAIGLDTSDIEPALNKLLRCIAKRMEDEVCFLYFQLSRDGNKRRHAFLPDAKVNLLITLTKIPHPDVSKPVSLATAEDKRHCMCNVKTLNLLPAVLACSFAESEGYDEAVLIRDGAVTECSHSNLFIIKEEKLITHPLDNRILPGIMRARLIDIARALGIECEERRFTKAELDYADEIIITSSSRLAQRAYLVDGVRLKKRNDSLAEKLCRELHSDFLMHTV